MRSDGGALRPAEGGAAMTVVYIDSVFALNALADYLLANESITGQQFANLMEGKPLGEASTTSLTDGFEE